MTTRPRSPVGLWLTLWLGVALAGPLVVGSDAMRIRVRDEVAAARPLPGPTWLGAPPALRAANVTSPPQRGASLAGLPAAGQRAVAWADGAVDALAWQWRGAGVRLRVLGLWLLWLSPLFVATVVDGLVARAVKAATFGYQNPAAFAVARHGLAAACLLPALVLVWPLALPPLWAAAWCAGALLPLRLGLVHLQPVFTR